jgi:hypothetical protein
LHHHRTRPADRVNDIEDTYKLLTKEQYGIVSKCNKFASGRQVDRDDSALKAESAQHEEGVEADAEDLILCGTAFRTLPRIRAALTNTIEKCDTVSTSFPSREDIVRLIAASSK